jgi:chaperone modulatory protein CbpM
MSKQSEAAALEAAHFFSFSEIVELSGLTEPEIVQLVECECLLPQPGDDHWRFDAHCLALARAARRLRDDFELDVRGVELALTLLGRIEELESQIGALEARLPRSRF